VWLLNTLIKIDSLCIGIWKIYITKQFRRNLAK
jgi:hypothetical protein